MQSKGVENQAKSRRQNQTAREIVRKLLSSDYQASPQEVAMLEKLGMYDAPTCYDMLIVGQFKSALQGNTKAFDNIINILGEKPVDKIEIVNNGFVDALNGIASEVCTEDNLDNG